MKASKFIKNVLEIVILSVLSFVILLIWLFVDEWIHNPESKYYYLGLTIYIFVGIFGLFFLSYVISKVTKLKK